MYQRTLEPPSIVTNFSFSRVKLFIMYNPTSWVTVGGEGACHGGKIVGALDESVIAKNNVRCGIIMYHASARVCA